MYRIERNEVLLVNSITIIIGTLGYHRGLIGILLQNWIQHSKIAINLKSL